MKKILSFLKIINHFETFQHYQTCIYLTNMENMFDKDGTP